jgi:hypothetical protein
VLSVREKELLAFSASVVRRVFEFEFEFEFEDEDEDKDEDEFGENNAGVRLRFWRYCGVRGYGLQTKSRRSG